MYTVMYAEKVNSYEEGIENEFQYEDIQGAINGFADITLGLLSNREETGRLQGMVHDSYSDPDDVDWYSIGIQVSLIRGADVLASLDLVFDPRANRLKIANSLFIEHAQLDADEADAIDQLTDRLF